MPLPFWVIDKIHSTHLLTPFFPRDQQLCRTILMYYSKCFWEQHTHTHKILEINDGKQSPFRSHIFRPSNDTQKKRYRMKKKQNAEKRRDKVFAKKHKSKFIHFECGLSSNFG